MPTIETKKTVARMNFRLPANAKRQIERAAASAGLTVTDFAITALTERAEEVLEKKETRQMTDRDRDIFLRMLDADAEPNEAFKDAFETHRRLIAK